MASGVGTIQNLQGKVTAGNALVVTGGTGTSTGTPGTVGTLQGKVDSTNRLVIVFE